MVTIINRKEKYDILFNKYNLTHALYVTKHNLTIFSIQFHQETENTINNDTILKNF